MKARKGLSICLMILGIVLVFTGEAAFAATVFIRPTGQAPSDPNAVQAAINSAAPGDTIILLSTNASGQPTWFNFGDPNNTTARKGVTISKPLTIEGEDPVGLDTTTGAGSWPTQIYGGQNVFTIKLDAGYPDGAVTISQIQFGLDYQPDGGPYMSGAFQRTLRIGASKDVFINKCKFVNLVKPTFAPITCNIANNIGTPSGHIVIDHNVIKSLGSIDRYPLPTPAELPTGGSANNLPPNNTMAVFVAGTTAEIAVTDNYVEDFNKAFHLEFCGLLLDGTYLTNPKNITIKNNMLRLRQLYNPMPGIMLNHVNGATLIEGNQITLAAGSIGYGISIASVPMWTHETALPTYITDNTIDCISGSNPVLGNVPVTPEGVLTLGKEGFISVPVYALYGPSAVNCMIQDLTAEGNAKYGIVTRNVDPQTYPNQSAFNIFNDIDFSGLQVESGYLSFSSLTHDNTGTNIMIPPCTPLSKRLINSGVNNSFAFDTGAPLSINVAWPSYNLVTNQDVILQYTLTGGCVASTTSSPPSGTIYSATGMYGFAVTATDTLNGTTATKSVSFTIDKIPPQAIANASPGPNGNGWNNGSVTVTFTGTDNLSGIDFCTPPITLSSAGANQVVSGTCTDKAGNISAPATIIVNIDKTAPVISGMPVPGLILWPPNHKMVRVATVTDVDALSGLASFNITGTSNEPSDPKDPDIVITGSGLGPRTVDLRADRLGTGSGRIYTLTATAVDLAGNTTTVITTVVVPHDQGK